MKKLIYLILLIGIGSVYGQQTILSRSQNNRLAVIDASNREVNLPKETKGSQYFQEKFMYAFVDGMEKPHKMRYNAFFDEMEFEMDGVTYDLDKSQYKSVNFDDLNKKYVIVDYLDGNKMKMGYLIELVGSSKYSLYKREKMEFIEAKKSGTGFGIDSPPQYKPKKEEYFMKTSDGSIVSVPSSKGKMADLFGGDAKSASKFIKENKVSLSNEKDLKALFLNMNSN